MVLAILSFVCQIFTLAYVNSITELGGQLTEGSAKGVIAIMVVCTIVSFVTLFTNIKNVKKGLSKGKYITGIVFSAVGLAIGGIFCFSCFATMAALS